MSDSDIPLRLAAQAALREIEDMHPDSSLSANDVRRMFGAFSDKLKWADIYPEQKKPRFICNECHERKSALEIAIICADCLFKLKQLDKEEVSLEEAEQNKMSSVTCDPCIKCGIEVRLGDGWDMASPKEREEGTFVRGCKKCFDEMKAAQENISVHNPEGRIWIWKGMKHCNSSFLTIPAHLDLVSGERFMTREEAFRPGSIVRNDNLDYIYQGQVVPSDAANRCIKVKNTGATYRSFLPEELTLVKPVTEEG